MNTTLSALQSQLLLDTGDLSTNWMKSSLKKQTSLLILTRL